MVVEYAPYGNLREFLRSRRPSILNTKSTGDTECLKPAVTIRDFISFAFQISRGMEHLAAKKVSSWHKTFLISVREAVKRTLAKSLSKGKTLLENLHNHEISGLIPQSPHELYIIFLLNKSAQTPATLHFWLMPSFHRDCSTLT